MLLSKRMTDAELELGDIWLQWTSCLWGSLKLSNSVRELWAVWIWNCTTRNWIWIGGQPHPEAHAESHSISVAACMTSSMTRQWHVPSHFGSEREYTSYCHTWCIYVKEEAGQLWWCIQHGLECIKGLPCLCCPLECNIFACGISERTGQVIWRVERISSSNHRGQEISAYPLDSLVLPRLSQPTSFLEEG